MCCVTMLSMGFPSEHSGPLGSPLTSRSKACGCKLHLPVTILPSSKEILSTGLHFLDFGPHLALCSGIRPGGAMGCHELNPSQLRASLVPYLQYYCSSHQHAFLYPPCPQGDALEQGHHSEGFSGLYPQTAEGATALQRPREPAEIPRASQPQSAAPNSGTEKRKQSEAAGTQRWGMGLPISRGRGD